MVGWWLLGIYTTLLLLLDLPDLDNCELTQPQIQADVSFYISPLAHLHFLVKSPLWSVERRSLIKKSQCSLVVDMSRVHGRLRRICQDLCVVVCTSDNMAITEGWNTPCSDKPGKFIALDPSTYGGLNFRSWTKEHLPPSSSPPHGASRWPPGCGTSADELHCRSWGESPAQRCKWICGAWDKSDV